MPASLRREAKWIMLFKQHILDGIAEGRIMLAFRRWKRPSVKSGGTRYKTSFTYHAKIGLTT